MGRERAKKSSRKDEGWERRAKEGTALQKTKKSAARTSKDGQETGRWETGRTPRLDDVAPGPIPKRAGASRRHEGATWGGSAGRVVSCKQDLPDPNRENKDTKGSAATSLFVDNTTSESVEKVQSNEYTSGWPPVWPCIRPRGAHVRLKSERWLHTWSKSYWPKPIPCRPAGVFPVYLMEFALYTWNVSR